MKTRIVSSFPSKFPSIKSKHLKPSSFDEMVGTVSVKRLKTIGMGRNMMIQTIPGSDEYV